MDIDLREKPGGIGLGPGGASLGAVPVYDERNQLFEMADAIPAGARKAPRPKEVFYATGRIRHQHEVPMCVGMANRALLDAAPIRHRPDGRLTPEWIWKQSQKVDEYPGESDLMGTSQNAACKVLVGAGLYEGYVWARRSLDGSLGLEDAYDWLAYNGPFSLCLPWFEEMNRPKGGFLEIGGELVGSHQQLVFGYDRDGTIFVQGSFGRGWGDKGMVYIRPQTYKRLFAHAWSSACAPTEVRRKRRRK